MPAKYLNHWRRLTRREAEDLAGEFDETNFGAHGSSLHVEEMRARCDGKLYRQLVPIHALVWFDVYELEVYEGPDDPYSKVV